MRITGGTWCGRRIKTPPGDQIRPTQDWVREALFSILAESVVETHWIDLFGGSGAVGLDALSRGAGGVTWIEKNVQNARLIYENFLELAGQPVQATQPMPGRGVLHAKKIHPRQIPSIPLPDRYPDTELVIADASAWLAQGGKGKNAKVLYADPPYEDARNNGFAAMLKAAKENDVVGTEGFFVAEMPVETGAETVEGWEPIRDRVYGKTRLVIWRREA
ncbi:MAG: RsmD family RNA methyltransferase [Kiritimatiellae bacterium]|nr:RsmD family RNA methyltransferase [Kiritimatiellia bacterium]